MPETIHGRLAALCLAAAGVAAAPVPPQANPRAERAVLYYFDGLHPAAIDRFGLPTLQRLKRECASVADAVMPYPWHPTTGEYGEMHTTSLPNPVTMAGNLFLRENTGGGVTAEAGRQRIFQDQFPRGVDTALSVGSKAYDTLSPGFSITHVVDTSDRELTDVILQTLERSDPKFYRIQLQDVGRAGIETIDATVNTPPESAATPVWAGDIWHPESPYDDAAHEADRQLSRFVVKMEELGRWDSTLFVFMADGQSRHGWHLPADEEAWRTPMIICGPGVRAGTRIPYAEVIDVVPTVAAALRVEQPNPGPGAGRVLAEAFEDGPAQTPEAPRRMLRLNEQIREYLRLTAELQLLALSDPRADYTVMLESNGYLAADPEPFLGIEQIDR